VCADAPAPVSLLDVETPAQPISITVATRLKPNIRAFIVPPSYKVRVEQNGIDYIDQDTCDRDH